MKKFSILILLAYAALLVGCNTMEGFGQDVQRVGNKIEDKAERSR